MKEKYTKPEMVYVLLEVQMIITTSPGGETELPPDSDW